MEFKEQNLERTTRVTWLISLTASHAVISEPLIEDHCLTDTYRGWPRGYELSQTLLTNLGISVLFGTRSRN
jgi:hypothetical protein